MARKRDSILDTEWWRITIYLLLEVALLLVGLWFLQWVSQLWGGVLYFSLAELWSSDGTVAQGLNAVWFIFLWAFAVNLYYGVRSSHELSEFSSAHILSAGTWISLNAGVFEELAYRWLRFSIAMLTLPLVNFILFGFVPGQMGLLHWLYEYILLPIANFTTFGALDDYLFHPASWVIGAAIISANGKFRAAHSYAGFLTWINSWFIGMVMFYLMFNYGLLTAIIAHVLYDLVVFGTAAFMNSLRPTRRSSRARINW